MAKVLQMAQAALPCMPCREEFMSAFGEQVELVARQEQIQKELETCGDDMDRMSALVDELDSLSNRVGGQRHRLEACRPCC